MVTKNHRSGGILMAFPSGHSHRGAASHGGRHLAGPENPGPSAVRGGGVDLWIRAAALGRRATVDPIGSLWIPCGTYHWHFWPIFQEISGKIRISLENRPWKMVRLRTSINGILKISHWLWFMFFFHHPQGVFLVTCWRQDARTALFTTRPQAFGITSLDCKSMASRTQRWVMLRTGLLFGDFLVNFIWGYFMKNWCTTHMFCEVLVGRFGEYFLAFPPMNIMLATLSWPTWTHVEPLNP